MINVSISPASDIMSLDIISYFPTTSLTFLHVYKKLREIQNQIQKSLQNSNPQQINCKITSNHIPPHQTRNPGDPGRAAEAGWPVCCGSGRIRLSLPGRLPAGSPTTAAVLPAGPVCVCLPFSGIGRLCCCLVKSEWWIQDDRRTSRPTGKSL